MNKNKAASIGIIGGADGPTAIFQVSKRQIERRQREQEDFLKRAALLAKPGYQDFSNIEDFLVEKFSAQPYDLSPVKREVVKVNVVLNHFQDRLDVNPRPGENATQEEWIRWCGEDTSTDQAREIPEEELGLQIKAYVIPQEVAEKLRQQDAADGKGRFRSRARGWITGWIRWMSSKPQREEKLTVQMEMTKEYLCVSGKGGGALIDHIALWQGVTQEDIDTCSPRFVNYAYTMKRRGLWK